MLTSGVRLANNEAWGKKHVCETFTCGPARSGSGTEQFSSTVLQQQVVLGLRDEPLTGLVLLHHV